MERSVLGVALLFFGALAPALAAESGGPLLTAETLGEWSVEGESQASFRMEDGVVIGQPIGHDPKNAFLCSPREYADFDLRFSFRITPRSLNSGVQVRSHVRDDGIVAGPQLEMNLAAPGDLPFAMRWVFPLLVRLTDNPWRPRYWSTGGVYGESLPTGWIYPGVAGGDADAFAEQGERLTKQEDWNALRLEAIGSRMRSWLNGELRSDFRFDELPESGRICLQVHGGEYEDPWAYRIEWRDLRLLEH